MAVAKARGDRASQRFSRARLRSRANRERVVGRAGRRSRLLHGQERPWPETVDLPRSPNSFLVLARVVRLTCHATRKQTRVRRAALPEQFVILARCFAFAGARVNFSRARLCGSRTGRRVFCFFKQKTAY